MYKVNNHIFFLPSFSYLCDLSNLTEYIRSTSNSNFTEIQNQRNKSESIVGMEREVGAGDKRMSPDGTRKLQDEINTLTKRNCELESQLRSLEASHSREMQIDSMDGSESCKFAILVFGVPQRSVLGPIYSCLIFTAKLKELEKVIKNMKQEKEEILKDKQDLLEKLKFQDKELKDAIAQKKLAMTEYSEVSDKLAELRQQKQKFSRQVSKIFTISKSISKNWFNFNIFNLCKQR